MDEKCKLDLKEMVRSLCRSGFTQESIAVALAVNQSTISRILSGKCQNSNFKIALGIQSLYAQFCTPLKNIHRAQGSG